MAPVAPPRAYPLRQVYTFAHAPADTRRSGALELVVPHLQAALKGRLSSGHIRGLPATVALASAGYPRSSARGAPLIGIEVETS